MPKSFDAPMGAVSFGHNIGLNTLRGGMKSLGPRADDAQNIPDADIRITGSARSLASSGVCMSAPSLPPPEDETPARRASTGVVRTSSTSSAAENGTEVTRASAGRTIPYQSFGGPPATVADRRFLERANDNKLMSLESFVAIVSDLHPAASERQIELVFRYFDKEGNGYITQRDFKTFWNQRDREASVVMDAETNEFNERGIALFEIFAQDGHIDSNGLRSLYSWCGTHNLINETSEATFIKQIDGDESGSVNYSELIDWLKIRRISLPEMSDIVEDDNPPQLHEQKPQSLPRNSNTLTTDSQPSGGVEAAQEQIPKPDPQRCAPRGVEAAREQIPKPDPQRWAPRSKKAVKGRHEMEIKLVSKLEQFFQGRDKLNNILRKRHEKIRKDVEDHVKKMNKEREKLRSAQVKELKISMKKKAAKSEEIQAAIAGGDAEFTQVTVEMAKEYREKSLSCLDNEALDAEVSFFKGALETLTSEHQQMFDKELVLLTEEFEIVLKDIHEKNDHEHKSVQKDVHKFIDDEQKKKKKKGVFMTDSEKKAIVDERMNKLEQNQAEEVSFMEQERDNALATLVAEHKRYINTCIQYYENKIEQLTSSTPEYTSA